MKLKSTNKAQHTSCGDAWGGPSVAGRCVGPFVFCPHNPEPRAWGDSDTVKNVPETYADSLRRTPEGLILTVIIQPILSMDYGLKTKNSPL